MKNFNSITIKLSIIFILFILTFIPYKSFENLKFNISEKDKLIQRLNNCFDLENKNSRRISESLNLVEYCMKKYGKLK